MSSRFAASSCFGRKSPAQSTPCPECTGTGPDRQRSCNHGANSETSVRKISQYKRRISVKQVTDHPLINFKFSVRSCRTIWLDLSLKNTLSGHARPYQKLPGQAFSGLFRPSAHKRDPGSYECHHLNRAGRVCRLRPVLSRCPRKQRARVIRQRCNVYDLVRRVLIVFRILSAFAALGSSCKNRSSSSAACWKLPVCQ